MTLLHELEQALAEVHRTVGPSIVSIGLNHRGTGVIVAPGHVLTNAHNLRDRTVAVTFADGRTEQGSVVGVDPDGDLTVIAVDTAELPAIRWGEGDLPVGRVVFALSAGRGGPRVSFGTVSSTDRAFRGPRGRRIPGALEHTAPLPRGSSGGPILDSTGTVVGINTHRLGQGFYLARSVDESLREHVDRLAGGQSITRRTLGVALAPAEVARRLRASVGLEPRDGLLVRGVEEGGAADRAGIREGDLLVGAVDRAFNSVDDLLEVLEATSTGDLALHVLRGADDLEITVTAAHFDPPTVGEGDGEPTE